MAGLAGLAGPRSGPGGLTGVSDAGGGGRRGSAGCAAAGAGAEKGRAQATPRRSVDGEVYGSKAVHKAIEAVGEGSVLLQRGVAVLLPRLRFAALRRIRLRFGGVGIRF